jgi:hypothetical protein
MLITKKIRAIFLIAGETVLLFILFEILYIFEIYHKIIFLYFMVVILFFIIILPIFYIIDSTNKKLVQ